MVWSMLFLKKIFFFDFLITNKGENQKLRIDAFVNRRDYKNNIRSV